MVSFMYHNPIRTPDPPTYPRLTRARFMPLWAQVLGAMYAFWLAILVSMGFLPLLILASKSLALAVAATAFMLAIAVLLAWHAPVVEVGEDGLLITRIGLHRRYVSYAELREVDLSDPSTIRLAFHDGRVLHLRGSGTKASVAHLAERLGFAFRVATGADELAQQAGRRPGESTSEWLSRGRALLGTARASYRELPITAETVARIVANPRVEIGVRLIAASVAAEKDPADLRFRVAQVADGMISPVAREAMARSVAASEAELVELLDRVDAEAAAKGGAG